MGIGDIFNFGQTIIDKIWPDAGEAERIEISKAELKLKMQQAIQSGDLKELEQLMKVMLAEAQSKDPWTSRARPTFLYVIYVYILAAIPMGVLSAFHPEIATAIATGAKAWLQSIPGELYTLFGVGYLGYNVARSKDKKDLLNKLQRIGK